MASPEPTWRDKLGEIPDPAAGVADRPVPPPISPATPSATRMDRHRCLIAVVFLSVGWISGALWLTGIRGDIGSPEILIPLGAWLIAAVLGLVFAMRPRLRGLPPGVRVVNAVLLGVPLAYVFAVVSRWAPAPDRPGTPAASRCISLASTMTAGLLALASLLMYRSFTSLPVRRGAVIGAICGLTGAAGVYAHCPAQQGVHLLFAHGASIALGALVGGAFGALRGRV